MDTWWIVHGPSGTVRPEDGYRADQCERMHGRDHRKIERCSDLSRSIRRDV